MSAKGEPSGMPCSIISLAVNALSFSIILLSPPLAGNTIRFCISFGSCRRSIRNRCRVRDLGAFLSGVHREGAKAATEVEKPHAVESRALFKALPGGIPLPVHVVELRIRGSKNARLRHV